MIALIRRSIVITNADGVQECERNAKETSRSGARIFHIGLSGAGTAGLRRIPQPGAVTIIPTQERECESDVSMVFPLNPQAYRGEKSKKSRASYRGHND
jgi:hypothetical protein